MLTGNSALKPDSNVFSYDLRREINVAVVEKFVFTLLGIGRDVLTRV